MTVANKIDTFSTFQAQDVLQIPHSQFVSGLRSPTDIYIRTSENRYLLICKQGAMIKLEELHATSDGKVQFLYVRTNEFKNLVGFNLQIAGLAISKAEVSTHHKIPFLSASAESVFTEIQAMGLSQESCNHSKVVVSSMLTLLNSKPNMAALVLSMKGISDEFVKHSMMVSVVSLMIADQMGWVIPKTLERLGMGAFFHDIGMREIAEEIRLKPRHSMTSDEVKTMEEHVTRGAEILQSVPQMPNEVVAIALQHHENACGTGYPRRLKDTRMEPLAKIVSVADAFCDLVLPSVPDVVGRTPTEALTYMELSLNQPFNRQAYAGLLKCIHGGTSTGRIKFIG